MLPLLVAALAIGTARAVTTAEQQALEAIYDNTGGGSWSTRTNWKSGNACNWHGVLCDGDGHVLELNLGFNNLRGALPSNIGSLRWMRYLFLQNNVLTGQLPSGIGSLEALETLHLHNNRIEGALPSQIVNLSNLRVLVIFNNRFDGALPSNIGNLGNLERFYFNNNLFSGAVPASISSLTKLKGFYGNSNRLTSLPASSAFESMSELLFLDLHDNNIVSPVPDRFSPPGATRPEVDLSENNLDCVLPDSFSSLSHVVHLEGNDGFLCPLPALSPAITGVGSCISMTLSSISPGAADLDERPSVVITGTNLNQCNVADFEVRFGSLVGTITGSSDTSLTVTAPAAAEVGDVAVSVYTTSGAPLTSNSVTFTFIKNCPEWCTTDTPRVSGCNTETGECVCEAGWGGVNCAETDIACLNDCTGPEFGTCNPLTGLCDCIEGRGGADCSLLDVDCPDDCSGQGSCDRTQGLCVCDPPWLRPACATRPCPAGCELHGTCLPSGVCDCFDDWAGVDCSVPDFDCPEFEGRVCNDFGECDRTGGNCICEAGRTGSACEFRACAGACEEHGTCDPFTGICTCDTVPDAGGFTYEGEDCSIPFKECVPADCFGNGVCNTRTGDCICEPGWFAATQCEERNCPNSCSGNGQCIPTTGVCDCDVEWSGIDCSTSNKTCGTTVPGQVCSGNGSCNKDTGICICEPPLTAASFCSEQLCPSGCSGQGECDTSTGVCSCDEGFAGFDCSTLDNDCPAAPNGEECSGRGFCDRTTGTCVCQFPWISSTACDERPCPNDCSGNGECFPRTGVCNCTADFIGRDCATPFILCPTTTERLECSGFGVCDTTTGLCNCNPGHSGNDCSVLSCPIDCSNAGICNPTNGTCTCDEGRTGDACEIRILECPTEVDGQVCSGNGRCDEVSGVCICNPPFLPAFACNEQQCPNDCTSRGVCNRQTGVCSCDEGWTGEDCQQRNLQCPLVDGLECAGNGFCDRTRGECVCDPQARPPWRVETDCATRNCPGVCQNGGSCNPETGFCECTADWQGPVCADPYASCPADCSGHGTCLTTFGRCSCDPGYDGLACDGCLPGFVQDGKHLEEDSNLEMCFQPTDCDPLCESFDPPQGTCSRRSGICECLDGFTGPVCAEFVCENACNGRGTCVGVDVCECNTGFTGSDCSEEVESAGSAVLAAALAGGAVFAGAVGGYYYMRRRAIKKWREKMGVEMK